MGPDLQQSNGNSYESCLKKLVIIKVLEQEIPEEEEALLAWN